MQVVRKEMWRAIRHRAQRKEGKSDICGKGWTGGGKDKAENGENFKGLKKWRPVTQ